jgi:hypothetical protein
MGVGPTQPAPAGDPDEAPKAAPRESRLVGNEGVGPPRSVSETGPRHGRRAGPYAWVFASCDTHLPKALRSFAFLPYFARKSAAPSSLRSALHARAAFRVSL